MLKVKIYLNIIIGTRSIFNFKTVDLNSFTAVEDDEDSIAGDIEHTGIVSSNDFDNNNDEDDNY